MSQAATKTSEAVWQSKSSAALLSQSFNWHVLSQVLCIVGSRVPVGWHLRNNVPDSTLWNRRLYGLLSHLILV